VTLGPPIRKPPPPQPEWVPTETKGILRNTRTGALRTNLPLPRIPVPDIVLEDVA
jgi:hypothetical protein